MRMLLLALSGFIVTASTASASTLVVTNSGTFSNATPASVISAPGGSFSFSFNVISTPTVSAVVLGSEFDVAFSNFSYLLNGAAVSAPVGGITFFNSGGLGLFNLCFGATCLGSPAEVLALRGAQAYFGSEASPTLLTGSYPTANSLVLVGTSVNNLAADAPLAMTQASAAVNPEPSSFVLLGTGIAGLLSLARRRYFA